MFMCSMVMLVVGLLFSIWVENLWWLLSLIVICLVLCIMWVLVRIRLLELMMKFEF